MISIIIALALAVIVPLSVHASVWVKIGLGLGIAVFGAIIIEMWLLMPLLMLLTLLLTPFRLLVQYVRGKAERRRDEVESHVMTTEERPEKEDTSFIGRLPKWLRWTLFLPVSAVVTRLVYLLRRIISEAEFGSSVFTRILSIPLASVGAGLVFVWLGWRIVPSGKRTVALLLAVMYTLGQAWTIADKARGVLDAPWWEILAATIPGTLVALATGFCLPSGAPGPKSGARRRN